MTSYGEKQKSLFLEISRNGIESAMSRKLLIFKAGVDFTSNSRTLQYLFFYPPLPRPRESIQRRTDFSQGINSVESMAGVLKSSKVKKFGL
jgi:hypothetical protein